MKERGEDVRKMEEALVRHFRGSAPGEVPPLLARRTVARFREALESGEVLSVNGTRLSAMVWRFTLVTCLIAVLLGAWGMSFDMQSQLQLAEFMVDEAAGIEWVQEFGLL